MYQKNIAKKNMLILLIEEIEKIHYVLINNFNTLIYNCTLHRGRKDFRCYFPQDFSTEVIFRISF